MVEEKNTAKEEKSELELLAGKEKTYKIGGREFVQRPLVVRHLPALINSVSNIFAIVSKQGENLDLTIQGISPDRFIAIANASEDSMKELNRILVLVLRAQPGEEEFIADNCELSTLGAIISDFFEINDVGAILENFRRTAAKVSSIKGSK